jgi:hypothetical protein
MTPTLNGRWQTRIVTLATLGLLVTALFAWGYDDSTFFKVLFYVGLFGIVWDVIFIALQQLRWDRDWPPVFQVASGVGEGVLVYLLIDNLGLPGIDEGIVPLDRFIAHYGLVWLAIFIWVQGPMRAIFPFWRFHGGRIL